MSPKSILGLAECFPQQWHPLLAQAQVREMLEKSIQLAEAVPQDPGADAVRASSLASVKSIQCHFWVRTRCKNKVVSTHYHFLHAKRGHLWDFLFLISFSQNINSCSWLSTKGSGCLHVSSYVHTSVGAAVLCSKSQLSTAGQTQSGSDLHVTEGVG